VKQSANWFNSTSHVTGWKRKFQCRTAEILQSKGEKMRERTNSVNLSLVKSLLVRSTMPIRFFSQDFFKCGRKINSDFFLSLFKAVSNLEPLAGRDGP
jgi:hypothetical protein